MTVNKKREEIEAAAAAAMNEVLSQGLRDLLLNATEDDLIGKEVDAEIRKGNAEPPFVWNHAPAMFHFSAMSAGRLNKVAQWQKLKTKLVTRVHASVIGESKVVLIRAAADDDRTAYAVNRYQNSSGIWLNLIELLGPQSLTVPSGYKEKFDVFYVPRESPLWPGLVFDLGQPTERGRDRRKKEAESQPQSGQQAQTKRTRGSKGSAPTAPAPDPALGADTSTAGSVSPTAVAGPESASTAETAK